MLKFSGFAYLTSCHGRKPQMKWQTGGQVISATDKATGYTQSTRCLSSCWQSTKPMDSMHQGQEEHLNAQTHTAVSCMCKAHDKMTVAWENIDTEAGMLSGISRKRSIRSNPYWFTEFCNSQCLSHFAAPFIVVRAETSVAESCMWIKHVVTHILKR